MLASCVTTGTAPEEVVVEETKTVIDVPVLITEPETIFEDEPLVADEDGVFRQKTTFADLPGWSAGNSTAAFQAFLGSCKKIYQQSRENEGWVEPCTKAEQVLEKNQAQNSEATRKFFEAEFTPYALSVANKNTGLLTAYYEPELQVSDKKTKIFSEPILSRPDDLVSVSLRRLDPSLPNKILSGRVLNGRLGLYYDREEIRRSNKGVLAWGRPIDVFFLQIQGSGRIKYTNGETARAAFSGHNGRKYSSIGRELISRGELEKGRASKAAIENWMNKAGVAAAQELMNTNPRYVFFQKQPINDPKVGPNGTQGAALTSKASLAVDPAFHSFGSPIWIDTRLPGSEKDWKGQPTQLLVIAQDTGGAIKGALRGDLFYGSGDAAGKLAGIQKHPAKWWILMPNRLSKLRETTS
ncbi:MAG: MltA domain-containing protein [Robiginitomaculum sp.]|nr:MltA domain-containing protein [Robiginitomaculum sp.]